MLYSMLFLLTLAGYVSILTAICTVSHVTITGQLGCGDRALRNVIVELREHDTRKLDLLVIVNSVIIAK